MKKPRRPRKLKKQIKKAEIKRVASPFKDSPDGVKFGYLNFRDLKKNKTKRMNPADYQTPAV